VDEIADLRTGRSRKHWPHLLIGHQPVPETAA
jgi:hypothetical protein